MDADQSVQVLADRASRRRSSPAAYETATKKQWTQPIGFVHALFEVAIDSLKRAKDVGEKAAIRDAIAATDLATIVGPIAWARGP